MIPTCQNVEYSELKERDLSTSPSLLQNAMFSQHCDVVITFTIQMVWCIKGWTINVCHNILNQTCYCVGNPICWVHFTSRHMCSKIMPTTANVVLILHVWFSTSQTCFQMSIFGKITSCMVSRKSRHVGTSHGKTSNHFPHEGKLRESISDGHLDEVQTASTRS